MTRTKRGAAETGEVKRVEVGAEAGSQSEGRTQSQSSGLMSLENASFKQFVYSTITKRNVASTNKIIKRQI